MAAIKTISRSAIVAFSPGENLIATGTVAGSLDASLSSSTCLELFQVDFATESNELSSVGLCATAEPLTRLSWANETGLLAGGLADGSMDIWNPATLVSDFQSNSESVASAKLERHSQKIVGLEFNPITPNMLASGDADGTVYIWDLADVANPKHFPPLQWKGTTSISHLSWNRKVAHIFATTSYDGVCVVWDLKKQKSILSFSDPQSKMRYSAIQWNPEVPTELIVAIEDDRTPYLQTWDLRKANHPTQVFTGHTKGILSLSWCPMDSSMLVSCAKDNRTLFWDSVGEVIGELPRSNTWNFDVQWSPRTPGILSASSYDGKVGLYSIESCHQNESTGGVSQVLKAPKWLKRPVGASFGFGGKLVSFKKKADNSQASEVKVHSLSLEEGTVKRSTEIEEAVSHTDRKALLTSFCDRKASEAESDQEREVWEFLKIMFIEDFGRKALLDQLGFKSPDADELAGEFEQKAVIETDVSTVETTDDGEDFFENLQEPKEPEVTTEMNGKDESAGEDRAEEVTDTSGEAESAIEEALVVGDFKAAVARCISMNRMADALSIAYAGSQALGEKTRDEYVKRNQRSYFKVLSAVVSGDFNGLVASRPLDAWKQTLALLATYVRGEDWSQLTNALASKLDLGGNIQAATICYICAGNVDKTIEMLSRTFGTGSLGKHAVSNLQDLVEKSIVLSVAVERKKPSPALARAVERFCEILASEGLLDTAGAYLSLVPGELPQSLTILRDRIQRSNQVLEPPAKVPPVQQPIIQDSFSSYLSSDTYAPQQPSSVASRQSASPLFPNPGYSAPAFNQTFPSQAFSSHTFNYPQYNQVPSPNLSQLNQYTPPASHTYAPPSPIPSVPTSSLMVPRPPQPEVHAPTMFNPVRVQPPAPSLMVPRPPHSTDVHAAAGFNPVRVQPPPAQRLPSPPQPQPLISHISENPYAAPQNTYAPPAPPAPAPTIHNVDTQNVKDELKPVVATFKRLYAETSDMSNPVKKREVEDNSRKLGALFAKLNAGDVSPNVATKLALLCQALDSRSFPSAHEILGDLTSREWDECGVWLTAVRRITKAHQQAMR